MTEIMIVVAILSILALIVMPKIGQMIQKSNEAASRGHLGSVRSAIGIYYADHEGFFPSDLSPFLQPGSPYVLATLPQLYTSPHGTQQTIDYLPVQDPFADAGHWSYVNGIGTDRGTFWIGCTHTDLSAKVWSGY